GCAGFRRAGARKQPGGPRGVSGPGARAADRRARDRRLLDRPGGGDPARRRPRRPGTLPEHRDRGPHLARPLRSARRRPAPRARCPPGAPGALGAAHPGRGRDHLRPSPQCRSRADAAAPPGSPAGLRPGPLARRPARSGAARPREHRRAAGPGRGPGRIASRPRDHGIRGPMRALSIPVLALIVLLGAGFGARRRDTLAGRGHSLPIAGWLTTLVLLVLNGVLLYFGIRLRRYMVESEQRRERPTMAPRRHQLDLLTAFRTVLLARACAYTGSVVGGIFTGQTLFLVITGTGDPLTAVLPPGAAALAGISLAVLGVVVERWGRLPPGDGEGGAESTEGAGAGS